MVIMSKITKIAAILQVCVATKYFKNINTSLCDKAYGQEQMVPLMLMPMIMTKTNYNHTVSSYAKRANKLSCFKYFILNSKDEA